MLPEADWSSGAKNRISVDTQSCYNKLGALLDSICGLGLIIETISRRILNDFAMISGRYRNDFGVNCVSPGR